MILIGWDRIRSENQKRNYVLLASSVLVLFLLLILSTIFHFGIFFGLNIRDRARWLWLSLHWAILFGPCMAALHVFLQKHAGAWKLKFQSFVWGSGYCAQGASTFEPVMNYLSVPAALSLFYTAGNFIACIYPYGNPVPEPVFRDGRYLLLGRGGVIRTLTADEYAPLSQSYAHFISAHWMMCHLVLLVILLGYLDQLVEKSES